MPPIHIANNSVWRCLASWSPPDIHNWLLVGPFSCRLIESNHNYCMIMLCLLWHAQKTVIHSSFLYPLAFIIFFSHQKSLFLFYKKMCFQTKVMVTYLNSCLLTSTCQEKIQPQLDFGLFSFRHDCNIDSFPEFSPENVGSITRQLEKWLRELGMLI